MRHEMWLIVLVAIAVGVPVAIVVGIEAVFLLTGHRPTLGIFGL